MKETEKDKPEPLAKVFIGVPCYGDSVNPGIVQAVMNPTKGAVQITDIQIQSFSILPRNFNRLYCEALNARKTNGTTHFCLLHADIQPEPGWLDKIVMLMDKHKADVMSAIVPLKHTSGLTSTAIDEGENIYKVKRFTLRELDKLKEKTFTHEKILVNSAMLLIDLRKPWVEKIWFDFDEKIINEGGQYRAVGVSEDWLFSRRARELGAKIYATQEVKLNHWGSFNYPNQGTWGDASVDQGDFV